MNENKMEKLFRLFKLYWAKTILYLHGTSIRNSFVSPFSRVGLECNIMSCTIDKYSYVGRNSCIINTEIGKFCSIADNVYIGLAEHPISWVSTSPVFQNIKNSSLIMKFSSLEWNPYKLKTIVRNDVWIGHGVVVKQGVTIGNGAIIGSNSVVTKDIPAYAIVAGCPAKVIRYRFDASIIEKLEKSEWWNLNDIMLKQSAIHIQEPLMSLKMIEKEKLLKESTGGKLSKILVIQLCEKERRVA